MSSPRKPVIAIDGPAGAGKSTVAKIVATTLGLPFLDTGAMYRCIGLLALKRGISLDDPSALGALAEESLISFQPGSVLLNGEEVTGDIRTLEVSQAASRVSVHSPVRRALVARQKDIIAGGGTVLEGRDTTTVVAPSAEVKVFLTASAEERARRRWLEVQAKGETATLQQLVKETITRDYRDYTREDSPLSLAEDAVIIETFGVTPEEIAEKIIALAKPS